MREDMFKVLVERPRRGGYRNKFGRRDEHLKQDRFDVCYDADNCDELSNLEKVRPVGRGVDRKSLNENLEPLWRFLGTQVGRLWDDVYSEIRENLSPKNAVQMHVVQHLKDRVVTSTYMGGDGRVYQSPKYNRKTKGDPSPDLCLEDLTGYPAFYVHPVTRVFCVSPRRGRHKVKEQAKTKFRVTDLIQYRLIDGLWYTIQLQKIPRHQGIQTMAYGMRGKFFQGSIFQEPVSYEKVGDFLFPDGLPNYRREAEYGFANLKAVSKRQLGKRELRHIKKLLGAS